MQIDPSNRISAHRTRKKKKWCRPMIFGRSAGAEAVNLFEVGFTFFYLFLQVGMILIL
jgi:hypothetical protein